jgi:hypothetical protein
MLIVYGPFATNLISLSIVIRTYSQVYLFNLTNLSVQPFIQSLRSLYASCITAGSLCPTSFQCIAWGWAVCDGSLCGQFAQICNSGLRGVYSLVGVLKTVHLNFCFLYQQIARSPKCKVDFALINNSNKTGLRTVVNLKYKNKYEVTVISKWIR